MFNLATDADDPALGFTTGWLRELARHASGIDVITMRAGRLDLPPNVSVQSLGKEHGYSEPRRLIEFYRLLAGVVARNRHQACFAHMAPLFALLGYPLLKAYSIPITLWYTHTSVPLQLRLAARVVDRAITASPTSFGASTRKLVVTGHGIDTRLFSPGPPRGQAEWPFTILAMGRVAPIKGLEALVEGTRLLVDELGSDALRVRIVGGGEPKDEPYRASLRERIRDAGLEGVVTLAGPLAPPDVVHEYREAGVLVHLGSSGLDKVILEAMSCELPVVSSFPDYAPIAGEAAPFLFLQPSGGPAVAAACNRLLKLSRGEYESLGRRLRAIVVRDHSLERLVERLATSLLVRRQ